jgi:hypothetical protein
MNISLIACILGLLVIFVGGLLLVLHIYKHEDDEPE